MHRLKHPQLLVIGSITFLFLALSAANVWAKPAQDGRPRWTIPTFTPTPTPDTGTICVQVYLDRNRDGARQPTTEELLSGASLRLTGVTTGAAFTGMTAGGDLPYCFGDLVPDFYLVREGNPPGYLSTTDDVWGAFLLANTTVSIPFGEVVIETRPILLPLVLHRFERSR